MSDLSAAYIGDNVELGLLADIAAMQLEYIRTIREYRELRRSLLASPEEWTAVPPVTH